MTKRRTIGTRQSPEAAGAVTLEDDMMAYVKQLVTAEIAMVALDLAKATKNAALQTVHKADGAVLTGDDDLFVISGGPVRAKIVGLVTTVIGANATNFDLQIDVTEPAGTVDLNAAPVACADDAAGTIYLNIDSTSVFTPITAGASIIDIVAAPEQFFVLPVGTVILRSSAANTGVISWFMTYEKLSPDSLVVAAA